MISNISTPSPSTTRLFLISFAHLTIGMGIVALNTYIPAELRFLGWQTETIAYIIGFVTLFELSRMFVGIFGDSFPLFGSYRKNYIILGFIISSIGFFGIAFFINSILIILFMILYTIGSAIMSTIIDAFLIDESMYENKNIIAAMTQFFRLAGFALGGISGAILYGRLGFQSFYLILILIHTIGSLFPILLVKEVNQTIFDSNETPKNRENNSNPISFRDTTFNLISTLKSRPVLAMSLFLILYPIGLFAQDAILEPFAIDYLRFGRAGIGRMTSVWGTTTLIFIPLAVKIEKILGRIPTIFLGLFIASMSLVMIASLAIRPLELTDVSGILLSQKYLYLSLAFFGMGLGLMTTPGTAMMFEVCSLHDKQTASLIAFFGVLITLSRSFSAFLAGFFLYFFSQNFYLLFILEAIILFSALFPLFYISRLDSFEN